MPEPKFDPSKPHALTRSKKRQKWVAKNMAIRERLMTRIEAKEVELWKRKEELARKQQVREYVREKEAAEWAKKQRREERQRARMAAQGETGTDTSAAGKEGMPAELKTEEDFKQERERRIAATKIQAVARGRQGKGSVRRRHAAAKQAAEDARIEALKTIQ